MKNPYQKKKIDFLDCQIDISKGPFIPRTETEYWVKSAIKEIKEKRQGPLQMLDMFAGSGCIGIALLKKVPGSRVDFIEISPQAVSQINLNLEINGIKKRRWNIHQSSFFRAIKKDEQNYYHYIFANPPYVATERVREVEESVLNYEPKTALFSGKNGLVHIKKLLKQAKNFLKEEGGIYLEFDPKQKQEIETMLKKEEYKNTEFRKDQFEKIRWLKTLK